jgi:hypothetical protein
MPTAWLRALTLSLIAATAAAQERPDGGAHEGPDGGAQERPDGSAQNEPAGCKHAISEENTRRLYAALKDLHSTDGCALEDVRTDNDVMRVEWKKGGVSAPLIEIRPKDCGAGKTVTGPDFSLSVPAGAVEQCPAAVEKLKSLIATGTLGGAVQLGASSGTNPPPLTLFAALGGATVLLLAGFAIWWWRRRGKPQA